MYPRRGLFPKSSSPSVLVSQKHAKISSSSSLQNEGHHEEALANLPLLRQKHYLLSPLKNESKRERGQKLEMDVPPLNDAPCTPPRNGEKPTRSGRLPKRKRYSSSDDDDHPPLKKPPPVPQANGTDGNSETDEDDTGPIDSSFFVGKTQFCSSIMVFCEDPSSFNPDKFLPPKGWLQCGTCGLLEEISTFSQHKKNGAFLCMDCIKMMQHVIKVARKAEALVCLGQGNCVLANTKTKCAACFASSCLMQLDFTDDVYYKVWRSVPPKARENVPHAPMPDSERLDENRGKILVVDRSDGRIVHSYGSIPKALTKLKKENKKSKAETEDENLRDNDTLSMDKPKPTRKTKVSDEKQQGTEDKLIKVMSLGAVDLKNCKGFPILVTEGHDPVSPLCLECGSAGIEQLIFCCCCGEPYHPFCVDDQVLLSSYLTHFNRTSLLRTLQKWRCPLCVCCLLCDKGKSEKDESFVYCHLCCSSYHNKCAKKMPLKSVEMDKWICAACLQCSSCKTFITKTAHLRKLPTILDAESILCLDCFKRRKAGSFCPVCLSCYDDDDWDTKMMQCDECQKWIHARCEGLSDEKYFVLSALPETTSYICRICSPPNPDVGWRGAIVSEMKEGMQKMLELFQKRLVCVARKRRSLSFAEEDDSDLDSSSYPLYFTPAAAADTNDTALQPSSLPLSLPLSHVTTTTRPVPSSTSTPSTSSSTSPVVNTSRTVEEQGFFKKFGLKPCAVVVVDMNTMNRHDNTIKKSPVKAACTPEEKSIIKSGFITEASIKPVNITPTKQATPVSQGWTPLKINTPNRLCLSYVASINSICMTSHCNSVSEFRQLCLDLLPSYFAEMTNSGKYVSEDKLLLYLEDTLKQVFPWWTPNLLQNYVVKDVNDNEEQMEQSDMDIIDGGRLQIKCTKEKEKLKDSIVFRNVYWDDEVFIDRRTCIFCSSFGDLPCKSSGRLILLNPFDGWFHVNCAIWSSEVYEEDDGELQNVESAYARAIKTECHHCKMVGGSLNCCAGACKHCFHFPCAIEAGCILQTDKRVFCLTHSSSSRGQKQTDLQVSRKVFVWKNSNLKRKSVMALSTEIRLYFGSTRVDAFGNLVSLSVTKSEIKPAYLLPVGLKVSRIQLINGRKHEVVSWMSSLRKDWQGTEMGLSTTLPDVNIVIDQSKHSSVIKSRWNQATSLWEWLKLVTTFVDEYGNEWTPPYKPNARKRKTLTANANNSKWERAELFWQNTSSAVSHPFPPTEIMHHPQLQYILEQLPGVEYVGGDYKFSFFPRSGAETPPCPNSSGSVRSETYEKKKHDMFDFLRSEHRKPPRTYVMTGLEEKTKSKGLPMPMRFRHLLQRSKQDLVVLPSSIHGLGLFARRDIEMGEMLIEYAGEMIRLVLCDIRERYYESRGVGCYMFRVNRNWAVDATMKGNAARFINHSCDPNCESKIVKIFGKDHILIFALRNIGCGEELTYDYRFEREMDKLPCTCGATRCRHYLN